MDLWGPSTGMSKENRSALNSEDFKHFEVEVEVNLRPTVSRPVCLGVRRPSGTRDQFLFLLEIFFRQLCVCYFVLPSLTRWRVCNLLIQLFLGLARAVTLGSKSHRTHGHILLSHLRLPQPGGPGPHIYIPQEQGGPGTGFPFCHFLRLLLVNHVAPGIEQGSLDL
jgi:hypothetical protein